jgi:hypothetical protein
MVLEKSRTPDTTSQTQVVHTSINQSINQLGSRHSKAVNPGRFMAI